MKSDPTLELLALRWLRFDRRCSIVLYERHCREDYTGRPDVIGILPGRRVIEVEVKRSLADFRANATKGIHNERRREAFAGALPHQFYFLVPCWLAQDVRGRLPAWAGLMRSPRMNEIQQVCIEVKAPVNAKHERLTPAEVGRMLALQSNQLCAAEHRVMELEFTLAKTTLTIPRSPG